MATTVILLSLAAGVTDAIALLQLGGIFASVITGNLVVLAASATGVEVPTLVRVVVAVGVYALGVFAGVRLVALRRYAPPPGVRGRPRAAGVCLAVEVVLLAAFWVGWLAARGAPTGDVQIPLIALASLAMGVQTVAVQALGQPNLSTTYLTGALTRLIGAFGTPDWRRQFDRVQALALIGVLVGAGLGATARRIPALGRPVAGGAVHRYRRWTRTRECDQDGATGPWIGVVGHPRATADGSLCRVLIVAQIALRERRRVTITPRLVQMYARK